MYSPRNLLRSAMGLAILCAAAETSASAGGASGAIINPAFDKFSDVKDFIFRFKKDKLGNTRQKIEVKGPVPSVEGVIAILEKGGKGLELLQDAMYDTVRGAVSAYLAENENANANNIDWTKFSWEAIANQPREDRRSASIPDETWEAFATDYVAVMPGVTGKTAEQVSTAVQLYLKKLTLVKTRKDILASLKNQLALYAESSKRAEEFTEILELLDRRADTYLKADDIETLIANL